MLCFSRHNRLASKQDFQSVFANPLKVTRKSLLALYRQNQETNPRLGIIIGKQHVRLSVARNRLRRIIRESFRHHKETVKGLDIIVIVRSECSAKAKSALREDIDNLWQMLKIPSKPL